VAAVGGDFADVESPVEVGGERQTVRPGIGVDDVSSSWISSSTFLRPGRYRRCLRPGRSRTQ
jgi:hypothetical protein